MKVLWVLTECWHSLYVGQERVFYSVRCVVAGGCCWFVVREKYCWLAGGWWLLLVWCERKILLAGCSKVFCSLFMYNWIIFSHTTPFVMFSNNSTLHFHLFANHIGWRKWGWLYWPHYWIFWGDWPLSVFYLPLVLPSWGCGMYWLFSFFFVSH